MRKLKQHLRPVLLLVILLDVLAYASVLALISGSGYFAVSIAEPMQDVTSIIQNTQQALQENVPVSEYKDEVFFARDMLIGIYFKLAALLLVTYAVFLLAWTLLKGWGWCLIRRQKMTLGVYLRMLALNALFFSSYLFLMWLAFLSSRLIAIAVIWLVVTVVFILASILVYPAFTGKKSFWKELGSAFRFKAKRLLQAVLAGIAALLLVAVVVALLGSVSAPVALVTGLALLLAAHAVFKQCLYVEPKGKGRKGQLSVFIILGLLIVIATALFIVFRTTQLDETVVTEPITEEVPLELQPLDNFVRGCMRSVVQDGFEEAGMQGGYTSLNFYEEDDYPTESDGISLLGSFVPYWWYLESPSTCTDCVMASNMPTLERVEEEVASYVSTNLEVCLDGFSALEEQGRYDVIPEGNITTEVTVGASSVTVKVNYPLLLQRETSSTEVSDFIQEVPFGFNDIYLLARNITHVEANYQALEFVTANLISNYAGTTPNDLPPPYLVVDDRNSQVMWNVNMVERTLRSIFMRYVPLIRINGTGNSADYTIPDELPVLQAFFNSLNWDIRPAYPRQLVRFWYLDWPIHFDITPRDGQLLKGDVHKGDYQLSRQTINSYKFFYDISLPVVVEIRDTEAFDGEGYSFFFALEANIRNNKNLLQWNQGNGTLGPSDLNIPVIRGEYAVEAGLSNSVISQLPPEVLDETTGIDFDELLPPEVQTIDSEEEVVLMCDQRISGDVVFKTYDRMTWEPLPEVNVVFGCGAYAICPGGATVNQSNVFNSTLPVCVGGYLVLSRDGYFRKVVAVDTEPGRDLNLGDVYLEPKTAVNVTAVKYQVSRLQQYISGLRVITGYALANASVPLDDHNQLFLTITRVPEDRFEYFDSQTIIIDNTNPLIPTVQTFDLRPGFYTVEGTLWRDEPISLWADPQCYDREPLNPFGGEECINIPSLPMEFWQSGGLTLNNDTGYWYVSRARLMGLEDHEAVFGLVRLPTPEKQEDLREISLIGYYSPQMGITLS